ncbi:MAG: amidohydrolase family protein [Gammaproteobacteria bacterium]|nr:amidohydrolase family protein [Gammaproteobacteria bacterium]MDP2141173.1 amidohydrolase family protein [Gammaproteobacteria bacterium]MDP2349153.1 amidohydrolase family protein [Gammaproteobacteria bacterium]
MFTSKPPLSPTLVATALFFAFLSQPLLAQTTLIFNINGYTLNEDREIERFTALQFTGDKVDNVYTDATGVPEMAELRRIDGQGKTLLPGLIDAHGHILSYGLSLLRVDLTGTATEQEAVQRIVEFQRLNGSLDWIQGRGWNQVLWDSNEFPTAQSLDEFFGDTPVWLSRVDGHAGWANSAAMTISGVDILTEDPDGGQIIRDAEGRPTGVFVDNAMDLITAKIPRLGIEEEKLALSRAMLALAAHGLTSVHDAGVSAQTVQAYKELLLEGPLPIRVNAMLGVGDPQLDALLAAGPFASADNTFIINSIKLSADGALGSRGAALIEDYSDMPGHRGLLLLQPEQLHSYMQSAMNAGFQVNVHAIGDDANRLVLDNFAALIPQTGTRDKRHRVEHAQVLQYQDILRFAELGVIPSMQATHATSDKNMAQDRLGEIRVLGAYAWRKLLDSGAIIANGSDFPVESPNPFYGLHAAITRQDHQNQPPEGWFPEERMTASEALASFTIDAAYAGHQESLLGTLERGKAADFILLEQDIFTNDPSEIWKATVLETWVNGVSITE